MSGSNKWWVRDRTPEPADEEDVKPTAAMTKDELVAEAERRGLDTSGTKAELLERMAEPDE